MDPCRALANQEGSIDGVLRSKFFMKSIRAGLGADRLGRGEDTLMASAELLSWEMVSFLSFSNFPSRAAISGMMSSGGGGGMAFGRELTVFRRSLT